MQNRELKRLLNLINELNHEIARQSEQNANIAINNESPDYFLFNDIEPLKDSVKMLSDIAQDMKAGL